MLANVTIGMIGVKTVPLLKFIELGRNLINTHQTPHTFREDISVTSPKIFRETDDA